MIEQTQQLLDEAFRQGSFMLYFLMLGGGLMASVTPCTYPVLPLTVGYIANQADAKRLRSFLLSLFLVMGLATVYATLGMIVAAVGGTFGAIMGNGVIMYSIAMFYLLMGLFLLDAFPFPTPRFLSGLQAKSVNRKGMLGAFMVGGISGLIVGPCTGPILALALGAIAFTLQEVQGIDYALQVVNGGILLFLFGFGQGALILLAGVFTGLLYKLPKAGAWMETVKKGFALIIIVAATLLFVFVGQNTDFPGVIELLADSGPATAYAAAPPAAGKAPPPAVAKLTAMTGLPALFGPATAFAAAPPASGKTQPPAVAEPEAALPPDFTLPSLGQGPVTLSQLKGKKGVVLVFFATWCVSCMKEVPEIKHFAEMAQKENVTLFGVNYKQTKEIAQRFKKSMKINYEILLDLEGTMTTGDYGIRGLPHIVGINARGEIIYRGIKLPDNREEFIRNLREGL
jgi:cytochrome c-type biogenesis protein